jgi:hypothetical protein
MPTLSRELRAIGYRKLSARPKHHGHTALGDQFHRLELELPTEHSSLHGNLR